MDITTNELPVQSTLGDRSVPASLSDEFEQVRNHTRQEIATTPTVLRVPSPLHPIALCPEELVGDEPAQLDEGKVKTGLLTVPRVPSPLYSIPLLPETVEMPRVPDNTPIFSRHNVTENVVFPLRRSPQLPQAQRVSVPASPTTMTSVLGRVSSTWVWTKEQLQMRDVSGTMWSTLAGIKNSTSVGAAEETAEEQVVETLAVPDRDPYDSWPYIRTAMEDVGKVDEEADREPKNEEAPLASLWNWALGWASQKPDTQA